MARRYWLYKVNRAGGPAGYYGDWLNDVFSADKEVEWGGDYATLSPEVHQLLASELATGDVIAAYQTNEKAVVGFCLVTRIKGHRDARKIWLRPIERLKVPLHIHVVKFGTPLEHSSAVNGPVMMRELDRAQMEALVALSSAPKRVLNGQAPSRGYRP